MKWSLLKESNSRVDGRKRSGPDVRKNAVFLELITGDRLEVHLRRDAML